MTTDPGAADALAGADALAPTLMSSSCTATLHEQGYTGVEKVNAARNPFPLPLPFPCPLGAGRGCSASEAGWKLTSERRERTRYGSAAMR
jgi:hypothetical protein